MTPPIRSRHGLTRCLACGTHIEAGDTPTETSCPFCGETLRFGGPRRMPTGRGGLIAASLIALAGASCGSTEDPPPEPPPTDDPGDPNVDPAPPPDDPVPVPAYGVEPDPGDWNGTEADDPAGEDVYGAPPE